MKHLFFLIGLFITANLHAKYYIGDWGYNPCCGTGCYWFWADIWDDNGTNNIADDRYVGRARRMSCGLSFRMDGTVDIDKNLNLDSDLEYPKNSELKDPERIILFPNPVKIDEFIFLKNLPDNIMKLTVIITNLSNQNQYQFEIQGNSIKVPNWLQKGLYQVVIQSPDQRVYLQQRLVIE